MTPITTRFSIRHQQGANLFNTTDWENFKFLEMPHDAEGFPLRHLNIGTEFWLRENELAAEGHYRVIGISTYIYDEHDYGRTNAPDGSYQWGFEVRYVVEDI